MADDDHKVLSLYSTIDALLENGLDDQEVGDITSIANTFIESLNASHELTPTKHVVFAKLKLLLQSSTSATISSLTSSSDEELKSVFARQCLERNAIAVTENEKETEKLKILKLIYGKLPDPSIPLHQLFVTRSVVAACAGTWRGFRHHYLLKVLDSRRDADDNSDGELFDLTSTYAALCDRLWQAGGFRQFALTGETMEMMLRTKVKFSQVILKILLLTKYRDVQSPSGTLTARLGVFLSYALAMGLLCVRFELALYTSIFVVYYKESSCPIERNSKAIST